MVYNKYIGIIGGTGTIGSIIVKYLLQLQTHFHVLIGGRRSIKEISMSTFYNVSDCSTTSCVFDFLLRCTPL